MRAKENVSVILAVTKVPKVTNVATNTIAFIDINYVLLLAKEKAKLQPNVKKAVIKLSPTLAATNVPKLITNVVPSAVRVTKGSEAVRKNVVPIKNVRKSANAISTSNSTNVWVVARAHLVFVLRELSNAKNVSAREVVYPDIASASRSVSKRGLKRRCVLLHAMKF